MVLQKNSLLLFYFQNFSDDISTLFNNSYGLRLSNVILLYYFNVFFLDIKAVCKNILILAFILNIS